MNWSIIFTILSAVSDEFKKISQDRIITVREVIELVSVIVRDLGLEDEPIIKI